MIEPEHPRLSVAMDIEFCIEALEEALARFRRPDVFNSNQGSQFTSPRLTGLLQQRAYAFPWMVVADGWTMCLSSDYFAA